MKKWDSEENKNNITEASSLEDKFIVAGKELRSRLIIGTGKYKSFAQTRDAVIKSGADMVTVAVRRVNITEKNAEKLQDYLNPNEYKYLPNTAGCYSCDEAVRTLRLAREAGGWNLVKLEVIGDKKTLYPNVVETLKATEILIKDGFEVMAYTSDDPIVASELQDMGAVAIMPLAAPIGSGLGIQNYLNIRFILENKKVPVIIDAGVGTASDAAIAMEIGCDAVLMNTAIAEARDPILMAEAMKLGVIAGRKAFLAGRMAKKLYASASSPLNNMI